MPLARFDTIERELLLPLPTSPYALAMWKQAKLHPDCHVVFDHGFYSAPHRLIGQKLWVRAADMSVRIFYQHELVATHSRATRRGQRLTNPDHLPPAKVAGLLTTPASCVRRATEIGPATSTVAGSSSASARSPGSGRSSASCRSSAVSYSGHARRSTCASALVLLEWLPRRSA